MYSKNKQHDPFFKIKSTKRSSAESRTTLDTLHTVQIEKMQANEKKLESLIKERDTLLESNESLAITDDILHEQQEHKLKSLETDISLIQNKNEFLDYFLDTGEILYKYYDIQEKIQAGMLPVKQSVKKYSGTIFDVLEKAAKDDENYVEEVSTKTSNCMSRDKLLEEYLKKILPENVRNSVNISDDRYGECPDCSKEMVFSANEAVFTCMNCGFQEFVLIDSDKPSYKDPPREVSYYAYKRINHFNEWLAQFQAKESTDIPTEVFDSILIELKKERILDTKNIKQTKIREILKKLKLNKYYEHVPHIINRLNGQNAPIMTREVEEKLRYMFKEIQPSFQLHRPEGRNNFLSYSYVL